MATFLNAQPIHVPDVRAMIFDTHCSAKHLLIHGLRPRARDLSVVCLLIVYYCL